MKFTELSNSVFNQVITNYHEFDDVDTPINNPYELRSIEYYLYLKNWIDTVQWHLEDIIRDPDIAPKEALAIKRRIDQSNQDRTDLVERIDTYFYEQLKAVLPKEGAKLNTESPAWALDRLSILHVKLWHMREQVNRKDVSEAQQTKCANKLAILEQQYADLSTAITQLLEDMKAGERIMKVYRQMKMYNDPTLNPILYGKK